MRTLVWSIISERPIFHALPSVLKPLDDWGTFREGSRPAAVVALLYERAGELCVPFVLRRPDLPDHPGQVALPGGTVKRGEDAWSAAAREVEEEIGVSTSLLEPLGAGASLYTSVTNFHVVPFVARLTAPDPIFNHDPGELVGVLEVPLERLLDQGAWAVGNEEWMGELFEWEGSTIWGLTGRILADLLPRIRQARDSPPLGGDQPALIGGGTPG
jgi:8-oxo-dGTP pyrophosphatase MutT (NUDIX family)